ncbi:glutamate racemase [Streptomyces caniscabiei]|uniref:glutamate racemase n=1 Tax=Streptomyces caniscabiei TaxID=2746961 RepID=UPI0029A35832|nr:glutamate racemase [Streptomyces caniscabiei]MDX2776247.1 glutamate racemase [Streptomyces caniscabiei]
MKLGIFDSGIGGEAVAAALTAAFPQATILTVNDKKNVPYGDKTPQEVLDLTNAAIQPLLQEQCDIIIIACNTATAVAIQSLRGRYPQQKFIGIEPMIKTAARLTRNSTIAVCATPATLASDRYKQLVVSHGQHLTIIEPDCSEWAYMIEHNQLNQQHIATAIREACSQGADVIVLGCTHYHWIKDLILQTVPSTVHVIEPSEAIATRVRHLLAL